MDSHNVILDSQCFSYILEAIDEITAPTGSLAKEKIALLRSFIYLPNGFYITETVESECKKIKINNKRELHENFIGRTIEVLYVEDKERVIARAKDLMNIHHKINDCKILAEAELFNISHIITYDFDFLKRLSNVSKIVELQFPSVYWESFSIPRGAIPVTCPCKNNPLSKESWWRW